MTRERNRVGVYWILLRMIEIQLFYEYWRWGDDENVVFAPPLTGIDRIICRLEEKSGGGGGIYENG